MTDQDKTALLSKLRAEGVQAGDERESFSDWAWRKDGLAIGHMDGQAAAWEAWQERARRAALASAPVAGEARKPATISFVNGEPASCGCAVRFSDGGGEYSNVHYVTLCDTHNRAALLAKVIETGELTRPQHEDLEGEVCAALDLTRSKPTDAAPQASEADEEESATDAWRRLALQFDEHRMQALGHLRAMLADPQAHAGRAAEFLAAPPLSGEQVLADRIAAIAKAQADKDGGGCAKGAGKWPMLADLHLQALMFAYNEGYSKAYDGRVFPNPFSENGSQAAAWQLGTDDGTEARAAQHPRTDGGGHG